MSGENKLINDSIIHDIAEAVSGLGQGTITIRVRASKIMQIEVVEKKRFDDVWLIKDGAGI